MNSAIIGGINIYKPSAVQWTILGINDCLAGITWAGYDQIGEMNDPP
jgi:hypothetical protein